jgi:hypothetical protein
MQEAPQSSPLQFHGVISVKAEASSSSAHFPSSIPPLLHGLSSVKEEAPPSCARPPLATNLLPPQLSIQVTPTMDRSCMVEEEIPPRWQLEDNTTTANEITTEVDGKEEEEEQPQHFANHLTKEHLQLLFEIRQKQDDQMHSQSIIGQRMDILFDALTDAPARAICPTCGQRFTLVYTIHGQPGSTTD